jgi:hypothetical protein
LDFQIYGDEFNGYLKPIKPQSSELLEIVTMPLKIFVNQSLLGEMFSCLDANILHRMNIQLYLVKNFIFLWYIF